MSTTEFESVDDFLNHSTGQRGTQHVRGWKKEGSIRIWIHTRRLPIAKWSHSIPILVSFTDRATGEPKRAFWGRDHNCWEAEDFLRDQYKRDDEGYLESGPPEKCGACRLIDYVCKAIAQRKMNWTQELFRFEGSTQKKDDVIVHAGGLVGLFNSRKLSDAQKADLRRAGIRQDESWRESWRPRMQYVICIVDDDKPRDGVQILTETSSVGDKIKRVIRDTRQSLGDEKGNLQSNPYCIQLTYDDRELMQNRYHALRYERATLTPEVDRMIRSDPPDLRRELRAFNQQLLRSFLEKHAVTELPWDDIFRVPELLAAGDDDDFPPRDDQEEPGSPAPKQEARAPEIPMIPCDECKTPMREDARKCPKCGVSYTFDEDEPEPPRQGKVTGDRIPFAQR